jgi:hypothetical protein
MRDGQGCARNYGAGLIGHGSGNRSGRSLSEELGRKIERGQND